MAGLQAPVESGRVWRCGDDVRPFPEHLASGHRPLQQVRPVLERAEQYNTVRSPFGRLNK